MGMHSKNSCLKLLQIDIGLSTIEYSQHAQLQCNLLVVTKVEFQMSPGIGCVTTTVLVLVTEGALATTQLKTCNSPIALLKFSDS